MFTRHGAATRPIALSLLVFFATSCSAPPAAKQSTPRPRATPSPTPTITAAPPSPTIAELTADDVIGPKLADGFSWGRPAGGFITALKKSMGANRTDFGAASIRQPDDRIAGTVVVYVLPPKVARAVTAQDVLAQIPEIGWMHAITYKIRGHDVAIGTGYANGAQMTAAAWLDENLMVILLAPDELAARKLTVLVLDATT